MMWRIVGTIEASVASSWKEGVAARGRLARHNRSRAIVPQRRSGRRLRRLEAPASRDKPAPPRTKKASPNGRAATVNCRKLEDERALRRRPDVGAGGDGARGQPASA